MASDWMKLILFCTPAFWMNGNPTSYASLSGSMAVIWRLQVLLISASLICKLYVYHGKTKEEEMLMLLWHQQVEQEQWQGENSQ